MCGSTSVQGELLKLHAVSTEASWNQCQNKSTHMSVWGKMALVTYSFRAVR